MDKPLLLKTDNTVKRITERGARFEVGTPLTKKEKRLIEENCLTKCLNAYRTRMIKSGLLSDWEEIGDLDAEGYMLFRNILDKFDKAKCGPISKFDEEGRTKPKTIEFYFKNYFYGRVNFTACETRTDKKKKGVGPRESVYDVEYEHTFNETNGDEYLTSSGIEKELKLKSDDFKKFLVESYIEGYTQEELKTRWGKNFRVLKNELTKFKNKVKKKYSRLYLQEIGKLPILDSESFIKIIK